MSDRNPRGRLSQRAEKRPAADLDVKMAQSSNDWENADLGDDERKKKFLRLMGAGKKSHLGKFAIGATHGKHSSAEDSQKSSSEIEKQYNESMAGKVSRGPPSFGMGFKELEPASADVATTVDVRKAAVTRKSEDLKLDEISSTNSWETANLGDEDRKKKFLKLMGAGKKSHQGRFIIGVSSAKHVTAEESQKTSEAIEKQFVETVSQKSTLGFKGRHRGFGFVEEKPENPPEELCQPSSSVTSQPDPKINKDGSAATKECQPKSSSRDSSNRGSNFSEQYPELQRKNELLPQREDTHGQDYHCYRYNYHHSEKSRHQDRPYNRNDQRYNSAGDSYGRGDRSYDREFRREHRRRESSPQRDVTSNEREGESPIRDSYSGYSSRTRPDHTEQSGYQKHP